MTQQMQAFHVGDIIKVNQRINEGKKERVVSFKGKVLDIKGKDENRMFTVRQALDGVVVDRIFPLYSPTIEKIEIVEKPKKRVKAANLSRRLKEK